MEADRLWASHGGGCTYLKIWVVNNKPLQIKAISHSLFSLLMLYVLPLNITGHKK